MRNKKFKVGENYYYYDENEDLLLLGRVERKPHKAKEFVVVYPDGEELSTRLDNVVDLLYKKEDLPDGVLNEKSCNSSLIDIVLELEDDDETGVDAVKTIEKEAVSQNKDIIGKVVYQDGETTQYIYVSKDCSSLYVTNTLEDLLKWRKEISTNNESKCCKSNCYDGQKYNISINATKEDIEKDIREIEDYERQIEQVQQKLEESFNDIDKIYDYFKSLRKHAKMLWHL